MQTGRRSLNLSSADDTVRLAETMAGRLNVGDTILLNGEMGVGKSYFARHLILACLDVPEDIPSPTFTLVQTYHSIHADIWHADLYRLSGPADVDELGLVEAFDTAICLIEWPDRLAELVPENALSLTLFSPHNDDRRIARFAWSDPKWVQKLEGIS